MLPAFGAFLPICTTGAAIACVLTAFLLFGQARVSRSFAVAILAMGYLATGVLIVLHLLMFPRVFSNGALFGGDSQTATWLWVWSHASLPIFVVAYVALRRNRNVELNPVGITRPIPRWFVPFAALATTVVAAAILPATELAQGRLPQLIVGGDYAPLVTTGVGPLLVVAILFALLAVALATGLRNVTQLWVAVALFASFADCTIALLGNERYTLGWYVAHVDGLVAATVVLFYYLGAINVSFERFAELSLVDGLTGVANRRSFDESLEMHVGIASRSRRPLALLMIDVDCFKQFNDGYGHPLGDDALRAVASSIKSQLTRRHDLAARYGGEEFAVVLPATDERGAARVAEKIRAAVWRRSIEHRAAETRRLTVSVGVAALIPSPDVASSRTRLLAAADAALYDAKASGRNRVTRASDIGHDLESALAS